jgi:group I intron endonuclease
MIIYKVENKINGKVYIGCTTGRLSKRKSQHHEDSKNKNNKFYNAIKKYGWDNFKWSIIDKATDFVELQRKEIFWIKKYDSVKSGYNITFGGQGHNSKYKKISEECFNCKKYLLCSEKDEDDCFAIKVLNFSNSLK